MKLDIKTVIHQILTINTYDMATKHKFECYYLNTLSQVGPLQHTTGMLTFIYIVL